MVLSELDATACAELVRSGAASPRELVDAAIERIERHDPAIGAVTTPMFEDARARVAAGLPDGPFRGVPILFKDLGTPVAGVLFTAGLKPLRDANVVADQDGFIATALRRAGFVIVGKTNTSELGILPNAEPSGVPPTRNPYDLTRTTGGSSGGSAAAVAAGLTPIAHGGDGGGSIRIPSSCCGLFGLKPSRARISMGPVRGDVNGGLVNEHVLTRSVRDSAAVLDLLAGYQPGDPYASPPFVGSYLASLAPADAPRGLRIGFATKHISPDSRVIDSHPDCLAAVDHVGRLLTSLGHHVAPADIAALHDPEWVPRFLALWVVGVTDGLNEAGRVLGRAIEARDVEPLTWSLGELGKLITASGYVESWRWIHRQTRRIAAFWDDHDLWLTPTVTEPPPPLGTFRSPPDDPLAGIFRAADFAPFTAAFNATGQPACSIPLYRNAAGLPIGVQLVAAHGREDLLLRVAAQLEAAQPFVHAATRGQS